MIPGVGMINNRTVRIEHYPIPYVSRDNKWHGRNIRGDGRSEIRVLH